MNNQNLNKTSFAHLILLLAGMSLITVVTPSAASAKIATKQSLFGKLTTSSEVSVIVTFRSEGQIQTGNTSRAGRSLAMPLRSRQDVLLARMPKPSLKRHKRFQYVPQIAMTVDSQGLQFLLEDAELQVVEDKLLKPVLEESVPLVFSSHSFSQYNGNNWAVAVLDSGIDKNHPYLSGKVVSEACFSGGGGQTETVSLCPGEAYSSVATGSGIDCSPSISGCFHGTFVAGIAAGNSSSSSGVAKAGKLISIQVFSLVSDRVFCNPHVNCIGAHTSDIIDGLERVYALRNQYKIAAANLSLGSTEVYPGDCDDSPQKPIIDLLRTARIATVVASGNNGNSSQISSPACISSAIAVGSSKDTADIASVYSNSSKMLDLYAPGEAIVSSVPGDRYMTGNGTSFAAPHVAGAWAVLRQASPGSSVSEIENILKSKGPLIAKGGQSRRRLNVSGALDVLSPQSIDLDFLPILQLLLMDG